MIQAKDRLQNGAQLAQEVLPLQRANCHRKPHLITPSASESLPLRTSDIRLAVSCAVLGLGFVQPQACTVLQIILITAFLLHGSVASLPAFLVLLLTPTDFKGGAMELQLEKYEGVVVHLFGFPLTASYAIVLGVLLRGFWGWATLPRPLWHSLNRAWLVPMTLSAAICVYAGFIDLFNSVLGWSQSARSSLSLLTLWYAISLTRNWALVHSVMVNRVGPICGIITLSSFFTPYTSTLTCYYFPTAVGWATLVSFGSLTKECRRLKSFALVVLAGSLAVHIGGFRVSSTVADYSYYKLGGVTFTTLSVAMATAAILMAAFHSSAITRLQSRKASYAIATLFYAAYLALPFTVITLTEGKVRENKGNTGTLAERINYKLLVERSAIWRGTWSVISEPPYIIVSSARAPKMIDGTGREKQFGHSSHNLVLEFLRTQGFLSGGISLILLYLCLLSCTRAYTSIQDPAAGLAAISFIAGGMLNGVSVGHLLQTGPGFLFYVSAGLCMGAVSLSWHQDSPTPRGPSPNPPPLKHVIGATLARTALGCSH